ncbi:Tat pathway signal sequence domain protein [Streptomyces sp. TRM68416]|uniref:Tat pathway signal sequence domain protein n=1 Tax=Streptomyces sp. TRM68416 TaxID=2758412 RepID=UPI001661E315|nr:Tat pathway signal sequence domain protein [Streptomyces sp. TRM68416]MBD0842589.1 Tat pathway signal sequence domain protein [Streptomyces sp. TRM68416]
MSGVGPVEPGEGTHAHEPAEAPASVPRGRAASPLRLLGRAALPSRLSRLSDRHRRAAVSVATAAALLAGGGYLYATRPQPSPVPTPAPTPTPSVTVPPYPSQVVDLVYLTETVSRTPAGTEGFRFDVLLSVVSGPPVTVTRIAQPYAGLSVISSPRPPFRTAAGSSREITITLRVTDCEKAPGNPGLPFLDVTLRNTRAIQTHSFILGSRYAEHLSQALQVACSNKSG